MQLQSTNKQDLNKLFRHIEKLFQRLPVSQKDKRNWLNKRRREKVFFLAALQDDNLMSAAETDSLFEKLENHLSLSKNAQHFETLLSNLEHYLKQDNQGFVSFIYHGKQQKESGYSGSLNLFSHLQLSLEPAVVLSNEKEIKLKDLDENLKTGADDFYEIVDKSVKVFNELYPERGFRKYSCLYSDYILNGKGSFFNFSKMLHRLEINKTVNNKSTFKNQKVTVFDNEIYNENWADSACEELYSVINELRSLYRNTIKFDVLTTQEKIRLNYLFDNAFEIPEIENIGFDYQQPVVIELCSKGMLNIKNSKLEGINLISDMLDSKGFLVKSDKKEDEYWINPSYGSGRLILSKFNNMFTDKARSTKEVNNFAHAAVSFDTPKETSVNLSLSNNTASKYYGASN